MSNVINHAVMDAKKTHWQVILLALQGMPSKEIALIVRYSQHWVERIIYRFNHQGPNGLLDRRKRNGNKKLLSTEEFEELEKALEAPPPDGGLWTGPKVAHWMSVKLGRPVLTQTAWLYFDYLEQSFKVPRPHNPLSDDNAVIAFKKNFQL